MSPVRKYYAVSEAAQVLPYSELDLWHFIETGQLRPDLLSPRRKFVAVLWDGERRGRVGVGVCQYHGLLRVHPSWIELLLRAGEIILNREAEPVSRGNITGWSREFPFKAHGAPEEIAGWDIEFSEGELRPPFLLPLPVPVQNWKKFALNAISHFVEKSNELDPKAEIPEPRIAREAKELRDYDYDYSQNGRFAREHLRLSPEVVARLEKVGDVEAAHSAPAVDSIVKRTQASVPNEKQRESQLHKLIYRFITPKSD
jgi:hypothetical protein